jgi:branched-chain amino acid transport system permease protein
MEAASVVRRRTPGWERGLERARTIIDRYGLIAALLALPVVCAAGDLLSWGSLLFLDFSTEGDLSRLANNLKDGLSNGAIWALIALGYTLVYGIIELINFAHGEIFMIGAFAAFGLWGTLGLTIDTGVGGLILGLLASLVVAMLVSGSLAVLIERVGYRPLRNAPKLAPLITAVGFSFILQNIGILWLGASQVAVPDLIRSQKELIDIVGLSISRGDVLGGVIIGVIQQISDNRIGNEWTPAVIFGYLVLIMVFRPQGLIGEETREAG